MFSGCFTIFTWGYYSPLIYKDSTFINGNKVVDNLNGDKAAKIVVGKITTTHGHRGEVKVMPLTDFPQRFYEMDAIEVEVNGQFSTLHPQTIRQHKRFYIIQFKEIEDMNQAVRYRDSLLYIPQSEVKPLQEGRYYHFQLIGAAVYADTGEYLGKLERIMEPGGHDIFVVKASDGKELLIPAVHAWVKEIDVKQQRITVKLLAGLV